MRRFRRFRPARRGSTFTPMNATTQRTARILLTLLSAEFFGPALRDAGASHAMNPAFVGHARFHLVWFLAMLCASGVVNLYLLWGRREPSPRDLGVSAAWQGCTLVGFWSACLLAPVYGGLIYDASIHARILGVDENVLAFSLMSATWLAAAACLLGGKLGSRRPVAAVAVRS